MSHFQKFIKTSCDFFSLSESSFTSVNPNLISPFVLEIPKSILQQAQHIVSELHVLTTHGPYQAFIEEQTKNLHVQPTTLTPLLCSLDVHVNENGELKIIEINTNASGYLVNCMNYLSRGLNTFPEALDDLTHHFRDTLEPVNKKNALLAIMDHQPQQQKLFIEFLMYQKFIEKNVPSPCVIVDPEELNIQNNAVTYQNTSVTGIYNRHTDFYLETLPKLREAHNAQTVRLSPHPWGYALLADKNRMLDWQSPQWKEWLSLYTPHLYRALLETRSTADFSSFEDLWAERHKYFFKPASSYGSKSVYNGKSISRVKLESVMKDGLLAQELVTPPEITLTHQGQSETFKYDLRFFFYEDQIPLAFARLYRGQLTNLQTPLGGHAPLTFI